MNTAAHDPVAIAQAYIAVWNETGAGPDQSGSSTGACSGVRAPGRTAAPRAARTARCNAPAPGRRRQAGSIWRAARCCRSPSRRHPGRPGRRRRRPAGGPASSGAAPAGAGAQGQRVLDAARRLRDQVLQLGPLRRVDAGQVQHADAGAVGAEQRRAGAAVAAGVLEEVFAAVQPHRLQFGQRGADGGGADAALRQVDADARDEAARGSLRSMGPWASTTTPSWLVRMAK
jgi:hypothetical protein